MNLDIVNSKFKKNGYVVVKNSKSKRFIPYKANYDLI